MTQLSGVPSKPEQLRVAQVDVWGPGPQRENFPGGTKVDTGPPNLIGPPPSRIGAHAVKSFFVRRV